MYRTGCSAYVMLDDHDRIADIDEALQMPHQAYVPSPGWTGLSISGREPETMAAAS